MAILSPNPEPAFLRSAILRTVIYADIFDFPLTAREIHRSLEGCLASLEHVQLCLEDDFLPYTEGYYCLRGRESIISIRQRRAEAAARLWPAARRFGRLIAGLPFIRMVAVTGSLAVNNIDVGGDIDYLIVTRPGRLWLGRLLILVVGRLAAWRGLSLCPNYLISQETLSLHEQNLYAAHEFVQMVPLSGLTVYRQMWAMNGWVQNYLPNAVMAGPGSDQPLDEEPASGRNSLLEAFIPTSLGDWLERLEMERKIRKLMLENSGNPEACFSADLCKGHSNRHGWRTQSAYQNRLARLAAEVEK